MHLRSFHAETSECRLSEIGIQATYISGEDRKISKRRNGKSIGGNGDRVRGITRSRPSPETIFDDVIRSHASPRFPLRAFEICPIIKKIKRVACWETIDKEAVNKRIFAIFFFFLLLLLCSSKDTKTMNEAREAISTLLEIFILGPIIIKLFPFAF